MRRRQPAQMMALAAVAMVSMVAMLAFVIDAGTFFVVHHELQNAADAGALAGAFFLDGSTPAAAVSPACRGLSDAGLPSFPSAVQVACDYANMNVSVATRLCNSTAGFGSAHSATVLGPYRVVVVEVKCEAEYTFGRILGLHVQPLSAHAIAGLGTWDGSTVQPWGQVPGPDATRLFPD